MDIAHIKTMLLANEGRVPHFYQCTGHKVTIGVGHACESAADACTLSLLAPDGAPASASDITAAFAAVAAAPPMMDAPHYRPFSSLNMADDAIDQLLADDITAFTAGLRKGLPNFDSYPDPVQDALFDMAYNLGLGGLLKFHNLIAACDARNWDRAALESHRTGIGDDRNQATAALFLQAKTA